MPARLIEANPLVEETRNQVAIQRGPIVYCLESPDLPNGVRVQDVSIPADATLAARYDAEAAGRRDGHRDQCAGPGRRATGRASSIARYAARRNERIRVRFIPYFAWSNRGPSEMSVWLPVK